MKKFQLGIGVRLTVFDGVRELRSWGEREIGGLVSSEW